MNFKKKVSGSWTDVPHYISGTDTETITTLPATIYPLAQSVTIGLKGNTVQNGTPTSDSPVPVVGVGDLDNGNYKIPISSANTTTPVYLGEVQTTRKIKKLVLTGGDDENWNITNNSKVLYLAVSDSLKEQGKICYCTHYKTVNNVSSTDDVNDGECTFNDHLNWLYIKDSNYTSAQRFKNYLADQYAAGTPVTIWYVLATEETGIVNEPLMKIGDYADTVSNISIPVTASGDTISVGTTVQPSEVKVNYKGWHPVQSVHERKNGAWT